MPKKSFKNNPALAFIDQPQEAHEGQEVQPPQRTQDTPGTHITPSTHKTHDTSMPQEPPKPQEPQEPPKPEPYRINLKLRGEFKQFLDDEAWKARKSITEYLNELIAADMEAKQGEAGE